MSTICNGIEKFIFCLVTGSTIFSTNSPTKVEESVKKNLKTKVINSVKNKAISCNILISCTIFSFMQRLILSRILLYAINYSHSHSQIFVVITIAHMPYRYSPSILFSILFAYFKQDSYNHSIEAHMYTFLFPSLPSGYIHLHLYDR